MTTGGLGPTPDDLTREAVAEVCGEAVVVDEPTLAWLRDLWARRGMPFPAVNVKQAWRIPSATMLAKPERDGTGMVGGPARWRRDHHPPRPAPGDAPDVV